MRAFMDGQRCTCLLILCVVLNGCNEPAAALISAEDTGPTSLEPDFDPSTAGTIRGRVSWSGDVPAVPPLEVKSLVFAADGAREKWVLANPNAPAVDSSIGGVGNAVVFLRGVDPSKAKPWNHPAVRVEQHERQFRVRQGAGSSKCGFVRRGDQVEMVSRDPFIHVLHADGAAYFTLAFPEPQMPRVRPMRENGVVELTSAAGFFAMRAYLFVDEHPYYARTDENGRFVLENVPPGRYEIVGWMPNWLEARSDREPETGIVTRLRFRSPVQSVQVITVPANGEAEVDFAFSVKDFLR